MIKLDVSQLPSCVATLFMLRGAQLPPLQLQENPGRTAKTMLDEVPDDTQLLGCESLADEGMAAAVRGLLYLWNGWLGEGGMYAQAAPERERLYIESLCERHRGNLAAAKSLMQQVGAHPIAVELAEYGKEAIGLGVAPLLKRLGDMIEMAGEWEPFAFIDVWEQARAGKLDPAGVLVVRQLQGRELELLFTHCFENATGTKIAKPQAAPTAPRKRATAQRPVRRHAPLPRQAESTRSTQTKTPAKSMGPQVRKVGVYCPKCRNVIVLPDTRRGTNEKCERCGTTFLVPQEKAAQTPGKK